MDVEKLKKLKEEWEKKGILTTKEINRLYFFLFEITESCEKISKRIDKDIKNASKSPDSLKLADELIDVEIDLGVAIDYFKDARKFLNKVTDRLYNKYSEES